MELPIFQVDAFTDKPFKGNPAAVVLLDKWLPDEVMQSIASENNLSETAFICLEQNGIGIRWFTPKTEVELCGHATLASAFVVFKYLKPPVDKLTFITQKSGNLFVTKTNNNWIEMDFPPYSIKPVNAPIGLIDALGTKPLSIYEAGPDMLLVYGNEKEIRDIKPDFLNLAKINTRGVIITAPREKNMINVDFVSRFFAPRLGISEDPVTGSAHCSLTPYWTKVLNKSTVIGYQLSVRGGLLKCELKQDRVIISGQAVCVLEGNLIL